MIHISTENNTNMPEDSDKISPNAFCKDFIRGCCSRENCRFIHELPPLDYLKELFRFCHDFQNKRCFRSNCKFIHSTREEEERFYATGILPHSHLEIVLKDTPPSLHSLPPPEMRSLMLQPRDEDSPPEAKLMRFSHEDCRLERQVLANAHYCPNCESLEYKVKLLHENIRILLKKVADLNEKNIQLTSMNEFLLVQTGSVRDQSCVITSRHGTSAPVSLATVSVTPVVSLAGALPALVPTAATPNLTLAPAASRAQLLTPAPQILTVSTTQQLVGNSGALIVTSAGAQQLMQVSDSGTLMGGGQTVVAVPAQLTLAPPTQQLISNATQTTVQQLVQTQLAPQHQAQQFATQQSVQHLAAAQQSAQHLAAQQSAQHLAAQQSAQHLAAQQSAQHLAAQQSAQHLAAQQSAQHMAQQSAQHLAQQSAQHAQHMAQQSAQHLAAHQSAQHLAAQQNAQLAAQQSAQLAAQQSAQQQLVPSAQQLVHQTSTQQITISSTSQPMALTNSQAQPITFPMISQSILPH